ncbi:MAG TPA: hypothetical protein VIU40_12195 [Geobacteraceae bacterium]
MTETSSQPKGGFLRYFGLDTGEKARRTVVWVLPYLAFFALLLGGLSVGVNYLVPLPLWGFLTAIGVALVMPFFFLARLRAQAEEYRAAAAAAAKKPDEEKK